MDIKDSGERTEFATGAVRDCSEGKGCCYLLPFDTIADWLLHIKNHEEDADFFLCMHGFQLTGDIDKLIKAANYVIKQRDTSIYFDILELSKHFENGAKKYEENNWRKGIPVKQYIDSAIRHYLKFKDGWDDEDHFSACLWNLLCCYWTEQNKPEMDNFTPNGERFKETLKYMKNDEKAVYHTPDNLGLGKMLRVDCTSLNGEI